MSDKKILGEIGEKIAQEYLIKKNYLIVELNWRYKKAEIDIKEILNIFSSDETDSRVQAES